MVLQTPLNMRLDPFGINAPAVTAIVTRCHQSRLRLADAARLFEAVDVGYDLGDGSAELVGTSFAGLDLQGRVRLEIRTNGASAGTQRDIVLGDGWLRGG